MPADRTGHAAGPNSLTVVLGNGSPAQYSAVPMDVVGLSPRVVAVSVGWLHACALTTIGVVKCWGYNSHGQLGNGSTVNSSVPADVLGLPSDVVAISAGGEEACALAAAGAVKFWGGWYPQSPVELPSLTSGVTAISMAGGLGCAVRTGEVKCLGINLYGQLGNGTLVDSFVPVDVVGLPSDVIAVSAGGHHACALTAAGAVKCWGLNNHGELGNGSIVSMSSVPVDVADLSSGVIAVSAGEYHACAITASGGIKCWGMNVHGELGDGTMTESHVPVDVVGF